MSVMISTEQLDFSDVTSFPVVLLPILCLVAFCIVVAVFLIRSRSKMVSPAQL